MFFLPRMYPPKIVRIKDTITRIKNPYGECANGTGTFIPQKLAIIVGIDITIVMIARTFITMFRLFEITAAYASIVPLKILL